MNQTKRLKLHGTEMVLYSIEFVNLGAGHYIEGSDREGIGGI